MCAMQARTRPVAIITPWADDPSPSLLGLALTCDPCIVRLYSLHSRNAPAAAVFIVWAASIWIGCWV